MQQIVLVHPGQGGLQPHRPARQDRGLHPPPAARHRRLPAGAHTPHTQALTRRSVQASGVCHTAQRFDSQRRSDGSRPSALMQVVGYFNLYWTDADLCKNITVVLWHNQP